MLKFLKEISKGKNYILNFDGSHNNQANKSGAGFIIRDNQGEFKLGASYNLTKSYGLSYCNVAITEAMALLIGLKLAKKYNLSIDIIRGDSTEVIDHVLNRSRRPPKPPLNGIINQIISMIDRDSQTIEVVCREANQVADKLAFWGSNSRLIEDYKIYTTYDHLPPQVAELIEQEKRRNTMKEVDNGEGSSMIGKVIVGGLAIAIAIIAYGLSNLSQDFYTLNFDGSVINQLQKVESINRNKEMDFYWMVGGLAIIGAIIACGLSKLSQDFHTLNFGGSYTNQLQIGGAGCIIRNKEKDLVSATSYNLDNLYYPNRFNVAIVQAIALRNGLKLAKNMNLKLNLIEGDSKEVIDRVLGRERRPPRVPYMNEIINEIKVALNDQSIDCKTQINLIPRNDNEVANELASYGSRLRFGMERTYTKDDDLTFKVAQLIQRDKLA